MNSFRVTALTLTVIILGRLAIVQSYAEENKANGDFRKEALQELRDCIKNKDIEPPPLPLKKIDKCKLIVGVDENGDALPCQMKANGACELH